MRFSRWAVGGLGISMLLMARAVPAKAGLPERGPANGTYRSEVDNSKSIYFPPYINQGRVASCDWCACAYYQMTYTLNRMHDRPATAANTFSPKFGFTMINNANVFPLNIWFLDIYDFLQKHGSPFLTDVPYDLAEGQHYQEWTRDPEVWKKALSNRLAGYEYKLFELDSVKKLLQDGEVLVVQFDYQGYKTGMVQDNPDDAKDDPYVGQSVLVSGKNGPDHTVALVGYNDHIWTDLNGDGKVQPNELGAVKLQESFQDKAVNKTFRWVAYDAVRDLKTTIFYENKVWRIRMRQNYQPKLLCEVVLNHGQREKLKMQFGRAFSENRIEAAKLGEAYVFDPSGIGFKPGASGKSLIEGGNCAFDGGSAACDGGFTFDLTDLLAAPGKAGYWYCRLLNESDQPVTLKSFKILDLEKNITRTATVLPERFSHQEKTVFIRYER